MTQTIRLDTKELDRIAAQLGGNRREVVVALAFDIEGVAKQNAPVDTGALRASLETEVQDQTSATVAIIHDGVEYGIFQELGTSRMAAHPFLFPAVESVINEVNSGETWRGLFE